MAASCCEHFIPDAVQPYDGRATVFAEVATDCVAHFVAQDIHGFGLGEDGLAKSTSSETAFIGFFGEKLRFPS